MPLHHKDYFELKAAEKKQVQGKLSVPPICLKAEHKFTWYPSSQLYQEEQWLIFGDNFRSY